jgi:rod shape-determining protein MreC
VDEFFGRYRNLSVLLAVVFAQIILLGYQVRTDRGSRLLREWTVRSITPVTKSVRGLTQWAGSAWENYFWLVGTKQDNETLRRQLADLKLQNTGLRSSLARFKREEKLVDYQDDLPSKTTLAQVIGKGANSNSREIFISRGTDSGVTAGMPVITPDGIVGKVQASYPGAALVMLISDPEAGVGVLLERSRAAGILKGTGHVQCRIDYVSHEVDVKVGEVVYTSGDDRVFPKGLRIGEVVKLDRGTDFQEIYLKPFAQLDRLEEVLVITSGVHQDLPESPQAQPPQFLMPLPTDEADRLHAGAAPASQTPAAAEGSADPAQADTTARTDAAGQTESTGRLTDADRLKQYYEAIAAQQGQRIGYGGPGTVLEFNPERLQARHAATSGRNATGVAGDPSPVARPGSAESPGTAPSPVAGNRPGNPAAGPGSVAAPGSNSENGPVAGSDPTPSPATVEAAASPRGASPSESSGVAERATRPRNSAPVPPDPLAQPRESSPHRPLGDPGAGGRPASPATGFEGRGAPSLPAGRSGSEAPPAATRAKPVEQP